MKNINQKLHLRFFDINGLQSLIFVIAVINTLFINPITAEVTVSNVFGNHMVIQQDLPIPIWGWSDPDENITVRFDTLQVQTKANQKGEWQVCLKPLKSDGISHSMVVSGKNTVKFEDILIGEVWIGSGQSNMALPMEYFNKSANAYQECIQPSIRLLNVPPERSKTPQKDFKGNWTVANADTCKTFSATLLYFGGSLWKELKVPVGLVCAARGSQGIEAFLPEGGPIYNAAIVPLQPMAMRGVVWYQGERNVQNGDGLIYGDKFKKLITGWRNNWGREFPFYFVQVAPFSKYKPDQLPPVWEAQTTCLKLPQTGMVVANNEPSELVTIHPRNKEKVGKELSLWALNKVYGHKDVIFCGPLYQSMKLEGKSIRIFFAHGQGLSTSDGKSPTCFEVAGQDGMYVTAKAQIDHDSILVSADVIPAPVMVRFSWHNDSIPNLINAAGLSASAFHTDNWTGGTAEDNIN